MTVILFLCSTVPMIPALYLMPDKRSRLFLGYMLLGMVVCLIASEVNTVLLQWVGGDMAYVNTNITELILAKHRHGALGKVELYFDGGRNRFMSLDKEHE